jgi:hypothetical protein
MVMLAPRVIKGGSGGVEATNPYLGFGGSLDTTAVVISTIVTGDAAKRAGVSRGTSLA